MAIQSIRVDDITGDPGADVIVIAVGSRAWRIDLVDPSVKALREAIRPWTDAGVELPGGLAAAAQMIAARAADPLAEVDDPASAGGDEGGGEAGEAVADPAAMTAEDRAHCRAWAQGAPQKVLNRHDITDRPGSRGSLSPKVTRAWVAEGRPAAV